VPQIAHRTVGARVRIKSSTWMGSPLKYRNLVGVLTKELVVSKEVKKILAIRTTINYSGQK